MNDGDPGAPSSGTGTAFVFAGGGSLGAVQVGMLKALVAAGVRPDMVVGSSVGAINAAFYAGMPDAGGVRRLEALWRSLRRQDVFPVSAVRSALCLLGFDDHFVDPGPLGKILDRHMPYRRLEEARIPCHVIASQLSDGSEIVISEGPVVPALQASTAIPAVFPPVARDGRTLIDGSVTSNTPLSAAIRLGASRIVLLPTGSPCAIGQSLHGPVAIALHALNLLIAKQLIVETGRLGASVHVAIVPPLCPLGTSAYDFTRSGQLLDRAEEAAAHWLAAGGMEDSEVPWQLRPHTH